MSPVRPLFSDGAILGADDLTALAQLDRDRDGRHARHLHTPGVAVGLDLATTERATTGQARYVDVTLQPGYAIDGTGRELVVASPMAVSPDRFMGDIPNPVLQKGSDHLTVWYPVFVSGLDTEIAASNGQLGCQASSGPSRIAEDVEIEFGRPGDANAEQQPPAPDAGPGNGSWRVLVGFVQLDNSLGNFVAASSEADGLRVQSAGVHAGVIAGQGGRVELRPQPAMAPGLPALVLDHRDGGSLVFGLRTGTDALDRLMTVDASGNLVVSGTLSGVQTSGSVLVSSGTAFDGTVLPLPAGADPNAIESGAAQLSAQVSPRYPAPIVGNRRYFLPVECRVDEDRRVHCWGTLTYYSGGTPEDVPSACDYLVLVSVPKVGA